MSAPDRGVRVDGGIALPVRKPCKLPGLARPGFHRKPRPANGGDPAPVRRTGALFAARPFPGSRRMTAMPRARGRAINREHARRRTRRTAKPAPEHKIFPDLPRRLAAGRIRRGRPASPMSQPGACRTRGMSRSASRRSRRRWRAVASRRSSTPARAAGLPAQPSPARAPPPASASRWMGAAGGRTMSSSRGRGVA